MHGLRIYQPSYDRVFGPGSMEYDLRWTLLISHVDPFSLEGTKTAQDSWHSASFCITKPCQVSPYWSLLILKEYYDINNRGLVKTFFFLFWIVHIYHVKVGLIDKYIQNPKRPLVCVYEIVAYGPHFHLFSISFYFHTLQHGKQLSYCHLPEFHHPWPRLKADILALISTLFRPSCQNLTSPVTRRRMRQYRPQQRQPFGAGSRHIWRSSGGLI